MNPRVYMIVIALIMSPIPSASRRRYHGMGLLILKKDVDGAIPISIINLSTGNALKSWKQPCHRNRRIECLDLVGERFVFKQEGLPMQVYDVRRSDIQH